MSHKKTLPRYFRKPPVFRIESTSSYSQQSHFLVALLLLHEDGRELQELMMDWAQNLREAACVLVLQIQPSQLLVALLLLLKLKLVWAQNLVMCPQLVLQ